MSLADKAIDAQVFANQLMESVIEDPNLRTGAKLLAILYGGPLGLFCCIVCAGGVFVCYTGKLADTLVVQVSSFAYVHDKKQFLTDAFWVDALKTANNALATSGNLMLSPIAIPAKIIGDKSSESLDISGMGDITKKTASDFAKAIEKMEKDGKYSFSTQEVGPLLKPKIDNLVVKTKERVSRLVDTMSESRNVKNL